MSLVPFDSWKLVSYRAQQDIKQFWKFTSERPWGKICRGWAGPTFRETSEIRVQVWVETAMKCKYTKEKSSKAQKYVSTALGAGFIVRRRLMSLTS